MAGSRRWPKSLGILITVIALAVIFGLVLWWQPSPTIVLVVRHAERNDVEACSPATLYNSRPNPPLALVNNESPRAKALAHVAGEAGLAAIYAGEFCRTQQTVQPLATQIGLGVTVVNQFTPPNGDVNVDDVAAQIKSHKGQVVLVAGHTNTIPPIIQKLGGGTVTPIPEDDFDNLYVVTIPRWLGKTKVVQLKYGAVSPLVP